MIMLRKLNEYSVDKQDMVTIYKLFIRSAIEQSSVVWSSAITKEEECSLERVQKIALKIIYQVDYFSYENALEMSKLCTMKQRYKMLALRFALKCTKSENTKQMFPLAPKKLGKKV